MKWRLAQPRSQGSENPAQVLSTARNAIRRVRMVMRGLPQRELTEEGKRLIGSIPHEATQDTKQARLRCVACSAAQAAGAQQHARLLQGRHVLPACSLQRVLLHRCYCVMQRVAYL